MGSTHEAVRRNRFHFWSTSQNVLPSDILPPLLGYVPPREPHHLWFSEIRDVFPRHSTIVSRGKRSETRGAKAGVYREIRNASPTASSSSFPRSSSTAFLYPVHIPLLPRGSVTGDPPISNFGRCIWQNFFFFHVKRTTRTSSFSLYASITLENVTLFNFSTR